MTTLDRRTPRVVRAATSKTMNTIMQTQLGVVRAAGFSVLCVCDDDEWTRGIAALDVQVVPIGMGRRPGLVRGLVWAFRFYRLLRRERPDIVHTHNAFHGLLGRPVARLAGTPVIVQTIHNWWYLEPPDALRARVFRILERFAARFCDAVLFINHDDVRRALDARLVSRGRLRYVGNGIDTVGLERRLCARNRDKERQALGLTQADFAIAMIARLEHPKDHGTLLRAFACLAQEVPNVRLLLAGQGLEEARVRLMARGLGVENVTMFLGHVDDVSSILAVSDVLVLSSHCEGFGRCLVEGMVARLPVVGSDVVGIRDVIRDGETGLLCGPGDPESLCDVLRRLVRDPRLRADLGAHGYAQAMREFDESIPARRVVDIYRTLLATSARRR